MRVYHDVYHHVYRLLHIVAYLYISLMFRERCSPCLKLNMRLVAGQVAGYIAQPGGPRADPGLHLTVSPHALNPHRSPNQRD